MCTLYLYTSAYLAATNASFWYSGGKWVRAGLMEQYRRYSSAATARMATGVESKRAHDPVARLTYASSDETTKQIAALEVFMNEER